MFQFQIGAIKSCHELSDALNTPEFQFQIGAIKSQLIPHNNRWYIRVSIPNWCD